MNDTTTIPEVEGEVVRKPGARDLYCWQWRRPRGMSQSHYRKVWRESRCAKPMPNVANSWCINPKGHKGECDDIPF